MSCRRQLPADLAIINIKRRSFGKFDKTVSQLHPKLFFVCCNDCIKSADKTASAMTYWVAVLFRLICNISREV